MKKTFVVVSCALFYSLFYTGCIFGGAEDASTDEKTKKATLNASINALKPGIYGAQYPWLDSNYAPLESEIILNSSGQFSQFWIQNNEPFYLLKGAWSMHDSNFYFHDQKEFYSDWGTFQNPQNVENDTNAVQIVNDSTFIRKEYTPVRQRPYWVTYTKKEVGKLVRGTYQMNKSFLQDSLPPIDVKFFITLQDERFSYNVIENGIKYYEGESDWYQIGSFLATENNLQRALDSIPTVTPWDTISGIIFKRINTISEASFNVWTSFDSSAWEPYNRIK